MVDTDKSTLVKSIENLVVTTRTYIGHVSVLVFSTGDLSDVNFQWIVVKDSFYLRGLVDLLDERAESVDSNFLSTLKSVRTMVDSLKKTWVDNYCRWGEVQIAFAKPIIEDLDVITHILSGIEDDVRLTQKYSLDDRASDLRLLVGLVPVYEGIFEYLTTEGPLVALNNDFKFARVEEIDVLLLSAENLTEKPHGSPDISGYAPLEVFKSTLAGIQSSWESYFSDDSLDITVINCKDAIYSVLQEMSKNVKTLESNRVGG